MQEGDTIKPAIEVDANPPIASECCARTLAGIKDKPLGFAVCQTNDDYRRRCKFAHDLGYGIVTCHHPRHEEIVARTVAADKPANG